MRRFITFFIPVIFTLGASLFQSALPAEKVKGGGIFALSDAGIFIGLEKGHFKEQGLEFDYARFRSASDLMAPLAAGELNLVAGGINAAMFNAIARGMAIVVVADKGSFLPGLGYTSLIVRKDLWDTGQVKSVRDLKGKVVAYLGPGAPGAYQWAKALEKEGLGLADVQQKFLPTPAMITALESKAIDAASITEPTATYAVERGLGVRVASFDKIIPNSQNAVIYYSKDFAAKKPELARRWMLAYFKGVRAYNDALHEGGGKREDAVQILIKYTGIRDLKVYDKMVWAGLNPNGSVNKESILDQQKFYHEIGQVPKTVVIPEIVDDSFVNHALQVLGRYEAR